MPYWIQWLAFAGLAIVSLVVFRQRVYSKLRPAADGLIGEGIEGELATAIDAIPPGVSGGVMLRGSRWTGRNQGPSAIPAGATCRVERRQGLILDVRIERSPGSGD
jgi:membrane protein implicated in regulation of membrane protease activity